jgi:hypothetical protein
MTKTARPRIDHRREHCGTCRGMREREVDRRTSRYNVLLPARCPTKEACEVELLKPFADHVPDGPFR